MSDESTPKETAGEEVSPKKASAVRIGGLGRAAQKLQAARDKAAQQQGGAKHGHSMTNQSAKGKSNFAGGKKPSFQRKAV